MTWPPGPKSLTHVKPYQWRGSALSGLRLLPLIRLKCATVDKSKRIRPQRVVTYTRSRAHTHCLLPPKRGVLPYDLSSAAVQQVEVARDLTPLPPRPNPSVAPTSTGGAESPSSSPPPYRARKSAVSQCVERRCSSVAEHSARWCGGPPLLSHPPTLGTSKSHRTVGEVCAPAPCALLHWCGSPRDV